MCAMEKKHGMTNIKMSTMVISGGKIIGVYVFIWEFFSCSKHVLLLLRLFPSPQSQPTFSEVPWPNCKEEGRSQWHQHCGPYLPPTTHPQARTSQLQVLNMTPKAWSLSMTKSVCQILSVASPHCFQPQEREHFYSTSQFTKSPNLC